VTTLDADGTAARRRPETAGLLYGLYALISVHFRKEEDIQLPAFDAASPELTQRVLERMEGTAGHGHAHAHDQ
jgi:hypothetical protein